MQEDSNPKHLGLEAEASILNVYLTFGTPEEVLVKSLSLQFPAYV